MKDIVIIGAAIADILVQPCDESVFVKGSYPCQNISMQVGGDALNEVTILANLHKNCELIAIVGKDNTGQYLYQHCKNNKIEIKESCIKDNIITGMNVVLIKEDGSRHFLTNSNGSLRKLRLEDIPLNFEAKIVSFASIFVFPMIQDKELTTIFKYAREKGMIVCADMTKCKHQETIEDLKESLTYIDYLFPNDEEAMLFTRTNTVEQAADILYKAGVKNIVIKCGNKGCYVKNKDIAYWKPIEKEVKCIDTTGAGDSFVAGFLKALSEEKDLDSCLAYANWCGAQNVQYVGATTWIQKRDC